MGGAFSKSNESSRDIRSSDPNASKTTIRTPVANNKSSSSGGRTMVIKSKEPENYLSVLEPKKTDKRMIFNPLLPKTLTPKGYAKYKILVSLKNKEFENLTARLKKEGRLWEDPDFPADDSSIGVPELKGRMEWKRPKEINPDARFFVGGASRFDIEQGALGDCWLLAVISSISNYPELFYHVIPKDQDLQGPNYCGVFRTFIWRFGMWIEVLVDDRLPVKRGTKSLAFMHSADDNEFWSALLEKAYAKLNGCYNNLSGGSQTEAMEDFTGGICESISLDPKKRPRDLFQKMDFYAKRCCLMGCAVESTEIEAKLAGGLIAGHAYSVTGVQTVKRRGQPVNLVRCRNPWGGRYEWTGDWSDKSPLWNDVDPSDRKRLELQFRDDGEFWMSFEDFSSRFTRLEVCHLGLESLEADQTVRGKRRLEESIFSGEWQKNINAGGCINNRETYHTNPQFRIEVTDPDPTDNENKSTVIVGLMQRDVRRKSGADFNTIGFMLYQIDSSQKTLLSRAQLMTRRPIGKSVFSNSREVTGNFRLSPGSYMIIPSTFQPNVEANFIVRALTEVAVQDLELDDHNEHKGIPNDITEAVEVEEMVLNERAEMEAKFLELADKKTNAIHGGQLMQLLNQSTLQDMPNFQGFTEDMCKSMVASVDSNLTGLLELQEFMDLWDKAKAWKMIFLKHDIDQSGAFQAHEFREALQDAGFNVSNKLINAMVHRYSKAGENYILFESFMVAMVRLRNVYETVQAQPKDDKERLLFSAEDYLRFGVYI